MVFVSNYLRKFDIFCLLKYVLSNLIYSFWNTRDEVKNLAELSPREAKDFLNSFDTVISDCDGVLWKIKPIPGVEESIKKLKMKEKRICYLSNNSTKTFDGYSQQFNKIGVQITKENFVHSGMAIVDYLKCIHFNKKAFIVSSSSLVDLLTESGIECITMKNECIEDLSWCLDQIQDDPDIGAVIYGLDIHFNFLKMNKTLTLLQRPDVHFLVSCTDNVIPIPDIPIFIGPGPFIKILCDLTGRSPIVFGKPSEYLKSFVMKQFNIVNPKRTLIIGDMMKNDIAFGEMCGFQKLLVLSGGSTLEDVKNQKILSKRPDFYIESIGHLKYVIEAAERS